MEDIAKDISAFLLAQGWPGIAVIGMTIVVVWLVRNGSAKARECEKYQEANVELWERVNTLQEKRVAEKDELVRALETHRATMETNTNAISGIQQGFASLQTLILDRGRRD